MGVDRTDCVAMHRHIPGLRLPREDHGRHVNDSGMLSQTAINCIFWAIRPLSRYMGSDENTRTYHEDDSVCSNVNGIAIPLTRKFDHTRGVVHLQWRSRRADAQVFQVFYKLGPRQWMAEIQPNHLTNFVNNTQSTETYAVSFLVCVSK